MSSNLGDTHQEAVCDQRWSRWCKDVWAWKTVLAAGEMLRWSGLSEVFHLVFQVLLVGPWEQRLWCVTGHQKHICVHLTGGTCAQLAHLAHRSMKTADWAEYSAQVDLEWTGVLLATFAPYRLNLCYRRVWRRTPRFNALLTSFKMNLTCPFTYDKRVI